AIMYGTARPSYIDPPKLVIEDCRFDTIGVWNALNFICIRDSTVISNCVFDSVASYAFDFKDSSKVRVEDCELSRCNGSLNVRNYASVEIYNSLLHTSKSSYGWNVFDAGTLYVENSVFSKTSSGRGPRVWNHAVATFRYSSITDFTDNGISCDSALIDLGRDRDFGHNCVWSDNATANRLYFSTKGDCFYAYGNWIDTLIFGGACASLIDTGSFFPPDSCDTSIAKIVIEPENKSSILPEEFELGPARPNPFNSTVTFDYKVPMECDIEIAIYDILGNKIRILYDGVRGSGIYSEVWDGKDDKGRTVASGTYLYRLKADDYEETRKMTFLK
ncbi:MAG: right-handed parallel beta-helix repeat-containing protein, partial [bacterium]